MDRRALTWAAVASLGFHAALLGWLWPGGTTRMATPQKQYVEAYLVPLQAPPLANAPTSANLSPPPLEVPAPRPTGAPTPKPQSPYMTLEAAPSADEPQGYLPFDAVDQAATPLGDWRIDTDLLPRGTSLNIVLKLWISSTGVIDRWEAEATEGDQALASRALAELGQTTLQPAFLNHVAVPSYRQLEIVVSRD